MKYAVISRLNAGYFSEKVLTEKLNLEYLNSSFKYKHLYGVYGGDEGIWISSGDAKFFDDYDAAERYLKFLKIFG